MENLLNEINIIIPMAGLGSRFVDYGFNENKYLLPMDEKLTKMIDLAILTLVNVNDNLNKKIKYNFIFILKEEKEENKNLRKHLYNICEINGFTCKVISINYLTEGPASTAYLAKEFISNDVPLIISNSDQVLDWNFINFLEISNNYDGCVLTYEPPYEIIIGSADKHSFVKYDENKKPIEFIEKKAISNDALVGVHFYKSGFHFLKAYEYIFKNNIRAPNGEFYLSYTYQALLNMNYNIGTYKLSSSEFFCPVGEPVDYFDYYNKRCPIDKYNLKKENNEIIINKLCKYEKYFMVKFGEKDYKINDVNKIFILISGKTNIESKIFILNDSEVIFLEPSHYLLFSLNTSIENKVINKNDYTRGWLIGDFIPSIENNKNVELGYLFHEKDSKWDFHYHKESIEINILINGNMIINNIEYNEKDVFIINKNIISCPIFVRDCELICIKIPSVPQDKYKI